MTIADSRLTPSPQTRAPIILLAMAAMFVVLGLLLFVPAGRLDWMLAWIYIGIVVLYVAGNWVLLQRFNPELIDRRLHFGKGTKRWDKIWAILFGPVMYAVYVVAGLEARGGALNLPALLWPVGFVLFAPGSALLTWAMVINPFFEKTVRIQTECDHRVIDSGPYAYIRHPGYLGFIGWIVGTPFMLGSAWSLIPTSFALIGIVIRTALEDRTLRQELDGYAAYAERVRYRLMPGVW